MLGLSRHRRHADSLSPAEDVDEAGLTDIRVADGAHVKSVRMILSPLLSPHPQIGKYVVSGEDLRRADLNPRFFLHFFLNILIALRFVVLCLLFIFEVDLGLQVPEHGLEGFLWFVYL